MNPFDAKPEHIALAIALGGASFVAIRILAVAKYALTTAQILLETQGPGNVAVGTLTSGLPLLVAAVGATILLLAASPDQRSRASILVFIGLVLIAAAALLAPAIALVLLLPVLLVVGLGYRSLRRGNIGETAESTRGLDRIRSAGILVLLLLLVALVGRTAPWLPHETIIVACRVDIECQSVAVLEGAKR